MGLKIKYLVLVVWSKQKTKKTDFNTKINEIENKITDHNHDKYITTSELNKLILENFAARLKEANSGTKTECDNKLTSFNK